MSFYVSSGLYSFIANLAIAIFVYSKNRKRSANVLFVLFSLCVSGWSFGSFLINVIPNKDLAVWVLRGNYLFAVWLPSFYVHFVYALVGASAKINRIKLKVCYYFSVLLSPVVFTPWFIDGISPIGDTSFLITEPGPLYYIFFAFFAVGMSEVIFHTLLRIDKYSGKRRVQIFYITVANAIAIFAGFEYFTRVFHLIASPPLDDYILVTYLLVIAYAIVRHKLLNIEVIIKKTLVFAGLFGMIMAVITLVSTFSHDIIGRYFEIPPTVATLLSVVLAVALYDPCRKFLVNATDRFLFQKKENIKDVLNKLSRNVITILDIDRVGETILVALQTTLRVDSGAIIVKNENEDSYGVLDAFGIQNKNVIFEKEDLFIRFFAENDRMINLEDEKQKNSMPVEVLSKLDKLNARIVMPLFIDQDLIGLLILGKKRSDQEFGADELDYFPTVASQVAIALSNARLYDILKKSQINFAQQAKMAAIGTLSAGISHEIKNPLNHIKVGIAMLRMNKKHGLFDNMERYKMEEEVFKTLDILDENVARANEVIERLSSFAKKPKEQKVEPVDLRAAAESALEFVHNDLDHNSIEIVKEFEPEFPSIKADLHTIEDILLNLIVNARHAIGHHGKITIKGSTQSGDLDFSISDTGKGIPKENLERIFDPFFTTKDVSRNPDKDAIKGSGLGLFIVREFIQRAGGQIHVESEVGKGTTFHLVFPKETWV